METDPLLTKREDERFDEDHEREEPTVHGSQPTRNQMGRISAGTLPIAFRSVVAFWFLGLCNNYGYVVMLSAAVDIIAKNVPSEPNVANSSTINNARQCNDMSTGAILLADIIPSLFIKVIAPFFPMWIHFRMAAVISLNVIGFILVSQAKSIVMAISGVVSIALASGLGEASILAYMSLYKNRKSISGWSSGTGGAGFFGSLSYMLVAYLSGNDRSQPLLIFLLVPAIMGVAFWIVLERPVLEPTRHTSFGGTDVHHATNSQEAIEEYFDETSTNSLTLADKLKAIPSVMKYMLPFTLVYLFEYFINQGLHELIHFDLSWMPVNNQYVAYQLAYQIGVFLSRSSIDLFTINNTWLFAILQGVNVVIFTTEAIYAYIPSIFIILALVVWEGLLGGASYVNTYNRINHEVPVNKREFSMSINSFGDALGISVAGAIAIPVHNLICSLPIYR